MGEDVCAVFLKNQDFPLSSAVSDYPTAVAALESMCSYRHGARRPAEAVLAWVERRESTGKKEKRAIRLPSQTAIVNLLCLCLSLEL